MTYAIDFVGIMPSSQPSRIGFKTANIGKGNKTILICSNIESLFPNSSWHDNSVPKRNGIASCFFIRLRLGMFL
jgi:hypothetical protein